MNPDGRGGGNGGGDCGGRDPTPHDLHHLVALFTDILLMTPNESLILGAGCLAAGADHFTRGGAQSLVWVSVLLALQQFERAIVFLAAPRHPLALHLLGACLCAVCLHYGAVRTTVAGGGYGAAFACCARRSRVATTAYHFHFSVFFF